MYQPYFGLQEAPFSIAVDPRYLFMGARHRDALAHLLYGVGVGGGFILLTGEVGTGKTTINRCLLKQLPENTDIAIVLNPALNAAELLATVCDELSIEYTQGEQSLKILTDKLHQFLLSNHSNNRNTVLLIDEAQHLSFDVLEQIRLLTNLETNTKKLLQIILVGQPELRTLLSKPELRQLAQRITARYQLRPLNLHETHAYIGHRLHVAGLPANVEIFPPHVVKKLYKISRGVPRLINMLCDRMLLGAYGQNKKTVDTAILKQAVKEVLGEEDGLIPDKTSQYGLIAAGAGIVAMVIIALILWQLPALTDISFDIPEKTIVANDITNHDHQSNTKTNIQSPDIDKTSVDTPATEVEAEPTPWSTDQQQALKELPHIKEISNLTANFLCDDKTRKIVSNQPLTTNLLCERQIAESWQDLKEYNRPAVLILTTSSRQRVYTTLIAIDDSQAVLNHNGGKQTTLSLEQLGKLWTGEFMFVWQAAPHFTKPIGLNDKGPMVKWLASQFAEIDGQQTLLANNTFNLALTQRVKIFQDENDLEPDGWVGLKTLLKLNEALGVSKTLTTTIEKEYIQPQTFDKPNGMQKFSQAQEG